MPRFFIICYYCKLDIGRVPSVHASISFDQLLSHLLAVATTDCSFLRCRRVSISTTALHSSITVLIYKLLTALQTALHRLYKLIATSGVSVDS